MFLPTYLDDDAHCFPILEPFSRRYELTIPLNEEPEVQASDVTWWDWSPLVLKLVDFHCILWPAVQLTVSSSAVPWTVA